MATIFWSWQSDLDARVTRDLVRDALSAAIDEIKADFDERPELTSDTKGVAGSPDIVATILAKIDSAAVFVGDITPVAFTDTRKAVANPNVLIELGYAKKALGLNRIICVWNTAFAGTTPEQLPFDMRTRRAPLGFHAPSGAAKQELAAARIKLRGMLVDSLRSCVATLASAAPIILPEWQETSAVTPALWFDPTQPLPMNEDRSGGEKQVASGPYAYVRLLPASWSKPEVFGSHHLAVFGPTSGFSWGMTRGGFITYSGSIRADKVFPLNNFTMQFKNTGEIWGVDARICGEGDKPYLYAFDLLRAWRDFLAFHVERLSSESAKLPYRARLGVTPLEGLLWPNRGMWGEPERALEANFEHEFLIDSPDESSWMKALESAWSSLREAFGQPPVSTEQFEKDLVTR